MKVKTLSLFAGAGMLAMASAASASFVGFDLEVTSGQDLDGNALNIHQIYAVFDGSNPLARISAWGSAPAGAVWTFGTNDPNGFYSAAGILGYSGGAASFAPTQDFIDFHGQGLANTSFLTIGRRAGDGASSLDLSPGVFGIGDGENIWQHGPTNGYIDGDGPFDSMGDGVVFNGNPLNNFGEVAWSLDNHGETRIMLAQLSVGGGAAAGEGYGIDITGSINWIPALGGESNFETFHFDTIGKIPAPGALALLGLAGLVGVRRRRN